MGTKMEKPIVLMVDDEEEIRNFGKTYFGGLGYRVVTASNHDGAMRAIKKAVHENLTDRIVAFIDISLKQGPSGLELLRDIKDQYAAQVVPYILTGSESVMIEIEAIEAGAFRVFHKRGRPEDWDRMAIVVNPEKSPILKLLAFLDQDELTGLDNFGRFRKLAMSQLRAAKARKHPAVISLLSIDVDGFKEINDKHGHPTGDEALKEIGRTLAKHLRDLDILCRKSGDEFYVLLPDTDEAGAEIVGKNLQAAVREAPINHQGWLKVNANISFGVATVRCEEIEDPEKTFLSLLYNADKGEGSGLYPRRDRERERA